LRKPEDAERLESWHSSGNEPLPGTEYAVGETNLKEGSRVVGGLLGATYGFVFDGSSGAVAVLLGSTLK
jgi:hypothetical protein